MGTALVGGLSYLAWGLKKLVREFWALVGVALLEFLRSPDLATLEFLGVSALPFGGTLEGCLAA